MQTSPERRTPGAVQSAHTVTFAFTDIEGSTARWERDPPAMQRALARHDHILREAIERYDGRVFKCVGDAFCAAFERPPDAPNAMVAAVRALAAEDFGAVGGLRIRVAIHTGVCEERDGDYFGTAVNRVARLLAIAHGGQVLLSASTKELLADGFLKYDLRDLGAHRLKDLSQPERVYQVVADGLQVDFPPLRSMSSLANNLPLQISSFIGRDEEVLEIASLVAAHRLVTIVGAGGVGKTRTALQTGAYLIDRSTDGVWFIDLAPLTSGDYVTSAIAHAMSLTLPADAEPLESLVAALKDRQALLIVDNCEHLTEAAGRVVSTLLKRCVQVRVLATSRQSLQITGECTYRLPSLSPDQAVQLFADRAAAADNRFAITPGTQPIVREVCERLDGIPLALELAASRVKIFSPAQLRDRLDERFRVLTGGSRSALPRQQTLRALIDWSYELLDERERALFQRLSIFVDGFTADGCTAVAGAEMDELEVLDALQSLVDKSLVLTSADPDVPRYRLLESTRAYAREKLEAAGARSQTAQRHFRYLHDRFQAELADAERAGNRVKLRASVVSELQDLRAALNWALEYSPTSGAELAAAVLSVWAHLNIENEALDLLNRYLETVPDANPELKYRLWVQMRYLPGAKGQLHAASETLRYARLCGNAAYLANGLRAYAYAAAMVDKLDVARSALAEAFAVAPPGDLYQHAVLMSTKGLVCMAGDDYDGAVEAFEVARRSQVESGDRDNVMICDHNLANVEFLRGNVSRAIDILKQAIATNTETRFRLAALMQRIDLCGYLAFAGQTGEAAAVGRDVLRDTSLQTENIMAVRTIENLGFIRTLEGDATAGARIAAYTKCAFERMQYEHQKASRRIRARYVARLLEMLGADELAAFSDEGEALSYANAAAIASR